MKDPNFNIDLLVTRLGKDLENGTSPDLGNDPILAHLTSFKQAQQAELKSNQPNSDDLWAQIEQKTQAKPARMFTLNRIVLAIAAVFAALAMTYMVNLSTTSSTETNRLLAETTSAYSTVSIDNQASVTLRTFSKLTEIESENNEFVVGLEGEAYFDVQKRASTVFTVRTNHGDIQVLGTRFTVKSTKTETIVFLEEGKVRAVHPSGSEFILMPNEAIRLVESPEIERIESQQKQVFTAWLSNEIVLDSRAVEQVFDELERHYNIQILQFPSNRNQERLSGILRLDSKEKVLSDLSLVLGGAFVAKDSSHFKWVERE